MRNRAATEPYSNKPYIYYSVALLWRWYIPAIALLEEREAQVRNRAATEPYIPARRKKEESEAQVREGAVTEPYVPRQKQSPSSPFKKHSHLFPAKNTAVSSP